MAIQDSPNCIWMQRLVFLRSNKQEFAVKTRGTWRFSWYCSLMDNFPSLCKGSLYISDGAGILSIKFATASTVAKKMPIFIMDMTSCHSPCQHDIPTTTSSEIVVGTKDLSKKRTCGWQVYYSCVSVKMKVRFSGWCILFFNDQEWETHLTKNTNNFPAESVC